MKGSYSPVDVQTWGDRRFRSLTHAQPNAQTLWMYLLTGPHNRGLPGIYETDAATIAQKLQWQPGDVVAVFKELVAPGGGGDPMALADWPAGVVFIPKRIYYDEPRSPSNVESWPRKFARIPESDLKSAWLSTACGYCQKRGQKFQLAFSEAFSEYCPMDDHKGSPMGGLNHVRSMDKDMDSEDYVAGIDSASPAADLCMLLRDLIIGNRPAAKVPVVASAGWRSWVEEMDRMLRIDKRDATEARVVITWCQADDFWAPNILSPKKLRKHYDQLALKMNRSSGGSRTARNMATLRKMTGGVL